MDGTGNIKRVVNPKEKVNLISKLAFWYTLPILKKGFKEDIKTEDIYEIIPELKSETLGDHLEKEWSKKKYRNNPSIYVLLWNTFGLKYALLNLTQILNVAITSVATPLFIGQIISYFVPGQKSLKRTDVIFYSCILIILNFIRGIYMENFTFAMQCLGFKVRAALGSLIYRRVTKLKAQELGKVEIGRYTTMISNDLTDVEVSLRFTMYFWGDLLKVIVVVFAMYRRIGWYSTILVGTVLLATPVHCKLTEKLLVHREVKSGIHAIYLFYTNKAIANFAYQLCFYFMLTTFIDKGENVTSKDIYFVISSLQSISFAVVITLPATMYHVNVLLNALMRISVIFKSDDQKSTCLNLQSINESKPQILFKNVSLDLNQRRIFNEITCAITSSGLYILTGNIGSGKSVFLKLILNDFQITSGEIVQTGKISYSAQEPWLFPASIKRNIIFTESYNEKRYQEVVKCCGLIHDFSAFEDGDNTIVAEHGINLSKGQQMRINLARAVYREADIYLLDDCFSVLDAVVADFVFNECIMSFLRGKIVILVSRNTNFLLNANKEIIIDNNSTVKIVDIDHKNVKNRNNINNKLYENEENLEKDEDHIDYNEDSKLISDSLNNKSIYHEEKESGSVPLKIYYEYLKFGGGICVFLIIILVYVAAQVVISYNSYLLGQWANLEDKISNLTIHNVSRDDPTLINLYQKRYFTHLIYGILILCTVLSAIGQTLSLFTFIQRISIQFHQYLIKKLLNAHMNFFSTHFLGNIINRLYIDILVLDRVIPIDLYMILNIFFQFFGAMILIILVNPIFIVPTTCYWTLLYVLRRFYLPAAYNLKRLDCSTRSAMIGCMSSTVDGLTTIQAFKGEKLLVKEFDNHQDLFLSSAFMVESCCRFFTFIGEMLSCIFVALVVIRFLVYESNVSPGTIGLTITQSFIVTIHVSIAISEWAKIDTLMTSFERLLEYTKMKQEVKDGLVLENWPKRGEIKFERVFMSYSINSNNNYALKDLNFTINAGEKVGIVGRTGSGKSSIISALFRLYDVDGKILIDGVDIKTLSLEFLREQIAVIPQDPFVFPGCIRDNIDPLRRFSDEKIWKALESSKLKDLFQDLSLQIKGESDLSVGQRQLICLARVLVRRTKIIVFDEAAENVDHEMGALMKEIVNNTIKDSTVITIAHKLDFVMDCDRVISLDSGEIKEMDRPSILLQNTNGRFYKMLEKDNLL